MPVFVRGAPESCSNKLASAVRTFIRIAAGFDVLSKIPWDFESLFPTRKEPIVKDKSISKAGPRARLEEDVEAFLKGGGKIERVETGVSGVKPKESRMKKTAKK